MAQGDKSGPMGQGPMTGRSLGFCAGNDTPGFNRGFGQGMGRGSGSGQGMGRGGGSRMGCGRGMGKGRGFAGNTGISNPIGEPNFNEITSLKAQAEAIKQAQSEIERRLNALEKE
ncbi:MAG TPA: DUF5320 domain-containing protein [Prolixibacteraceae bacterium]|nr:DUF5320 domain-containing protein [Prolixibacteraceae bacterium]